MADLRELLYEPWCPTCSAPVSSLCRPQAASSGHLQEKPPLATRMPEAVPAGLGWSEKIRVWLWYTSIINDDAAELLFIGNALKILTGGKLSFQIHASCDPAWMAAALHRLADKRDAAASSGLHQGDSGVD